MFLYGPEIFDRIENPFVVPHMGMVAHIHNIFLRSIVRRWFPAGHSSIAIDVDNVVVVEEAICLQPNDILLGIRKHLPLSAKSENLLEIPDDQILSTKVDLTIVGGAIKYQRTGSIGVGH